MNNPEYIRKKNNLNYFLSSSEVTGDITDSRELAAVFINLYYEDTLDRYLNYIKNASKVVDVYISTSNDKCFSRLSEFIQKEQLSDRIFIIRKENRGRDISSLLVVFKEYICRYTYFCFLHDKKEKCREMSADTDSWIHNLWDNLIASDSYILNILNVFAENPSIGLLVPPESFGLYTAWYYQNCWLKNYDNTQRLSLKLGLKIEIDMDSSPITIGTMFWAKTKALAKLLNYNWKYEEFPEEPMHNDGEINHAIERILSYVALDAGYYTGNILSLTNAGYQKEKVQDVMKLAFLFLRKNCGITNNYLLINYGEKLREIKRLSLKYKKIYIYGAGEIGKRCHTFLQTNGISVAGFVVSELSSNEKVVDSLKVYECNKEFLQKDVMIIIAVSLISAVKIKDKLEKLHFSNYIVYNSDSNCD